MSGWQLEENSVEPALPPQVQLQIVPESPSILPPASASNPVGQPAPFFVPTNETWLPMVRWCESNHLKAPEVLSSTPVATYGLSATNGNLRFTVGSRVAYWNGNELRLGFAPVLVDRKPFIHHLDLRKTIVPLLAGRQAFALTPSPVLVLDPGHGGEDAGARSAVTSSWEKQFTLDWARRVQALLVSRGWQVFLTRTNDSEMALSNRVSFATVRHADLFLSLHFNSAGTNRNQAGLETYCLTPKGMPSTITRGYSDDVNVEFPNNAFDSQNLQLAVLLHRTLLTVNGHQDRGVRRARFLGVLRGQQRPAVLIEGGYLSNPAEARLIGQDAYRQKLAEAVVSGLLEAAQPLAQSTSSGTIQGLQTFN